MTRRSFSLNLLLASVIAAGVCPSSVCGQDRLGGGSEKTARPGKKWQVDPLSNKYIEHALNWTAKSVARRYNLDEVQTRIARKMLVDNTWDFVNKHRDEMQYLMTEMYSARLSGEEPDSEKVKEWAKRAEPVFNEARRLIMEKNIQFHQVLNDEQKRIHRADLEDMQINFGHMEERLKQWRTGKYNPGEFQQGLTDPKHRAEQRKRAIERKKRELEMQVQVTPVSPEFWELYVEMFCDAFQLDEGQKTFAYSILNDIKTIGVAYRTDHARQIEKLKAKTKELSDLLARSKEEQEQLDRTKAELDKVYKPLLDLFEDLQKRLMAIPTTEQHKKASQMLGARQTKKVQTTKPSTTKPTTAKARKTKARLIK